MQRTSTARAERRPKPVGEPEAEPSDAPRERGPSATNVYLDARREWNERYGSQVTWARAMFALAILCVIVAGGAVFALYSVARQNRLVPYVVEVDKLGAPLAARRADEAAPADERVMRAHLARFVHCVRSVLSDPYAQRALIEDAYAGLNKRGAARSTLNEYFRERSPFKRAEIELVSVEIRSVLPLTPDTWRVEWDETVRARDGRVTSNDVWQGTFTVAVSAPRDEATLLKNPLGIYVSNFSWAKRL
jgi:type IV secretion system protein VirB5